MAKLLTDWKQSSLIPSPCSESLHSEGVEDRVNDQGPVLWGETSRIFPRLISFRELAEAAANQEASWAYSLVAKRKIKCGGENLVQSSAVESALQCFFHNISQEAAFFGRQEACILHFFNCKKFPSHLLQQHCLQLLWTAAWRRMKVDGEGRSAICILSPHRSTISGESEGPREHLTSV